MNESNTAMTIESYDNFPTDSREDRIQRLATMLGTARIPDSQIQDFVENMDPADVREAWWGAPPPSRAVHLELIREHARKNIQRFASYTKDILSNEIEQFSWSIGEKTYGRPFILEPNLGHLTIGRYCSLANPSIILGNHKTRSASTYPFMSLWFEWPGTTAGLKDHTARDVVIGNDVWIGHQAIILPGSTIGSGAVIGAGSTVRGVIPPYAICIGNPAIVSGYRFAPDIIERLLRVAWWEWPDGKVDRYIALLVDADISVFLDQAEAEDA